MLLDSESIAKKHLQFKEELLWQGVPVTSKTVKVLKPILHLLMIVSAAFTLFGLFVLVTEIIIPYQQQLLTESKFNQSLRTVLLNASGAIFFFAFYKLLPRNYYNETKTVYVITNQRALILGRTEKDPTKFEVKQQWGKGEFKSVQLKSNTGRDLMFVDDFLLADDEEGRKGRMVSSMGFEDVEDVKGAIEAFKKWKKPSDKLSLLENNGMGFFIKLPVDWTANSDLVNPKHRDNTLMALIAGEIGGDDGQLMREFKLGKNWNTLLLTKRDNTKSGGNPRHDYVYMLVESALRKELPEAETTFSAKGIGSFWKALENGGLFTDFFKKDMLIFEFDTPCVKDKKTEKMQLRRNAAAKKTDLKNGMESFEMIGDLKLQERGFKLRQLYSYKKVPWDDENPEICLHIRFTLLCQSSDKDKVFNRYKDRLTELAGSVEVHIPNIPESEADAKAKSAPEKKD